MRDAHTRAFQAGVAWRPVADSERARPPYELRPGTGRRGPAELWTRFDMAVERLNQAGASDNLADVIDAYAAVAQAASDLGRRAASCREVTRPALSSGTGWRSEPSPPRVPQAREAVA
jgi:hypothetical protein